MEYNGPRGSIRSEEEGGGEGQQSQCLYDNYDISTTVLVMAVSRGGLISIRVLRVRQKRTPIVEY